MVTWETREKETERNKRMGDGGDGGGSTVGCATSQCVNLKANPFGDFGDFGVSFVATVAGRYTTRVAPVFQFGGSIIFFFHLFSTSIIQIGPVPFENRPLNQDRHF